MGNTSSIQTGAITLTAASLVPIIDWAAQVMHVTIPMEAQLQISAFLITGAHAAYNYLMTRSAAKSAANVAPSTTAQ
ncbi:hypothetical protein QZM35_23150 [Burkholderia sp. AU45274]|uniref:hypothetical protein n=1 Tax=Burkholderia sp. AU45274 TaxID=3059205 RepID=UPI00264E29F8|nr:hypothetical protein [Burkholderia sp. AU45274]MDN7490613.1 hypothetical protein [Burkholderia sp. AU45274]